MNMSDFEVGLKVQVGKEKEQSSGEKVMTKNW